MHLRSLPEIWNEERSLPAHARAALARVGRGAGRVPHVVLVQPIDGQVTSEKHEGATGTTETVSAVFRRGRRSASHTSPGPLFVLARIPVGSRTKTTQESSGPHRNSCLE